MAIIQNGLHRGSIISLQTLLQTVLFAIVENTKIFLVVPRVKIVKLGGIAIITIQMEKIIMERMALQD